MFLFAFQIFSLQVLCFTNANSKAVKHYLFISTYTWLQIYREIGRQAFAPSTL